MNRLKTFWVTAWTMCLPTDEPYARNVFREPISKNRQNYKYANTEKPVTYIKSHTKQYIRTKLEGSSSKIDFRNAK